jgi:hypothetical protein
VELNDDFPDLLYRSRLSTFVSSFESKRKTPKKLTAANPADAADSCAFSDRHIAVQKETSVLATGPICKIYFILVAVQRSLRENSSGARCNCYLESVA